VPVRAAGRCRPLGSLANFWPCHTHRTVTSAPEHDSTFQAVPFTFGAHKEKNSLASRTSWNCTRLQSFPNTSRVTLATRRCYEQLTEKEERGEEATCSDNGKQAARHNTLPSLCPPSNLSKIHFNIIPPSTPGSSKWSPFHRFPH
jgi:hypothetical protein